MRENVYKVPILIIVAFIFYQIINFFYFPLFLTFPDEVRFLSEAQIFYESGEFWTNTNRAFEMPATGILYGLILSIFQGEVNSIIAIRLFQSILLILQSLLIYKISKIIFNNKGASKLALMIALFYPMFVFYQGLLLSETIFNTFLICAIFYMYKWKKQGLLIDKNFFFSNLFFIAAIYTKGTIALFHPIAIFLFYLVNSNTKNRKKISYIFLLSIVCYIALLLPWSLRNYQIFNSFVPFTTSSSANLYLGANVANKSGGVDWAKDVELDFVKSTEQLGEIEKSKVYKEKALNFIVDHPKEYFYLMWKKFIRLYSIVPNHESYQGFFYSFILSVSYGPVLFFFIASIFIFYKMWRELIPIYLLVLYFTAIHILFISSIRYRLPLEPFMILLASAACEKLYHRIGLCKCK